MNRFQLFLSRRWTGICFTIISIIFINCWQLVLTNFDYDNSYSITAAKNISEGHGYSIRMASTEDFSKSYYDPLNKWPPGYSWLLVLVHKFFYTDWIYSTYILNAIGLTLLVFIFRKTLFQLNYPGWIVNVAVLYFGFLKHPFHYYMNSDIFGLLFFMTGLYLLLNALKSERQLQVKVIMAGCFFGFSAYMKYLYVPLAFAPILGLFCYGWLIKRKDFQFYAIKSLLFLTAIIGFLLLFQYLHSGQAMYLNRADTGFFPDQVLRLAPIVPASFINIDFINMQISLHTPILYENLNICWSMINLFLIGWLAYISIKLYRNKIKMQKSFLVFYAIQALVFTGILFAYLSFLSIIKSKQYYNTFEFWVYNQELRYYVVFSIFLIQFALLIFMNPSFFFNKKGTLIFRFCMIAVLAGEIIHGGYYCVKQALIRKNFGTGVSIDQIYFESIDLTKRELLKNKNLVFCSNTDRVANMCSLYDVPVFYNLGNLKYPVPSSKPLTLILAVDKQFPDSSVPFLLSTGIKPDTVIQHIDFYIIHVPKSEHF